MMHHISIEFEMQPRVVFADPRVSENAHKIAFMRGPVVYCAEGVDNDGEVFSFSVDRNRLTLNKETPAQIGGFKAVADDLGEVFTVTAGGTSLTADDPDALFFTEGYREVERELKLIPYFMWGNRGVNQMRVCR